MAQRVDNLMELAGLALLVAFAFVVWAPAALFASGVILFVAANARAVRRRKLAQAATTGGAEVARARSGFDVWLDRALRAVAAYRSSSR